MLQEWKRSRKFLHIWQAVLVQRPSSRRAFLVKGLSLSYILLSSSSWQRKFHLGKIEDYTYTYISIHVSDTTMEGGH